MESMASSETTIITSDEEQVQEQNKALAFSNGGLVLIPEDDYKWKKYGQKYIRSVQKNRSYFRCVNKNCRARKKMEWPPNEPNNIDIAYEGDHNHRAIVARSENEEANQYDLATQIFGSART